MENPHLRQPRSFEGSENEHETAQPTSFRPARRREGWKLMTLGVLAGAGLSIGVVTLTRDEYRRYVGTHDPVDIFRPRENTATFQAAKNLIRQNRYEEARSELLKLEALEPQFPGLRDYLTHVEKELPNERHLRAAQAALGQKRLRVAKAELDQVSAGTAMAESVRTLKTDLKIAADRQLTGVRGLVSRGEREKALEVIDDVLAVFPHHQEAHRLSEELKRPAEETSPAPDLVQADAFHEAAVKAKTAGKWETAVEYLHKAQEADPSHSGAAILLAELKRQAKDLYLEAYALKDAAPSTAISTFRQAMAMTPQDDELHIKARIWISKLEKQPSPSPSPAPSVQPSSPLRKSASRHAATFHMQQAQAAKERREWAKAMESARRTLEARPGDPAATELIAEMRKKAQEIYESNFIGYPAPGYEERMMDIQLWQDLMDLTVPGDPLHERAKRTVELLKR